MDKDLDKYFGFACCWTCDECLLDIGIRAYICRKHGHTIGGNEAACLPTDCKDWKH